MSNNYFIPVLIILSSLLLAYFLWKSSQKKETEGAKTAYQFGAPKLPTDVAGPTTEQWNPNTPILTIVNK